MNDVVTSGAKPLFFLNYFASSRLDIDQAEEVCSASSLSIADRLRWIDSRERKQWKRCVWQAC